jgi:hypothetical protein
MNYTPVVVEEEKPRARRKKTAEPVEEVKSYIIPPNDNEIYDYLNE